MTGATIGRWAILFIVAVSVGVGAPPPAIRATERGAPPPWALLQRRLIDAMNAAALDYHRAFVLPGGLLKLSGKLDDDYECFQNWPLAHALGGSPKLTRLALEAWNATTRRWTYERNAVRGEFVRHYDMLHLSEGYVGFQNFALADPTLPENVARARRFAGFYLNEDPDAANFDPVHKILRSPHTGSAGPAFHADASYVLVYGHASLQPFVTSIDPARVQDHQKLYDEVVMRGDVPANLAVTGLITHAWLVTGDEKYRRWVLDYVDAWMERIRANGGVIPDNVGLKGAIGEYRRGQWWGGLFGWTSRYSVEIIFNALITATESAYLLSGDRKYLDLLRSQVDVLLDHAKIVDGNLLVPYRHGPEGWEDYRPLEPHILSHLWRLSLEVGDWNRLRRVLDNARSGPRPYDYADDPNPPLPGAEQWRPDGSPIDWLAPSDRIPHRNQNRHNEAPHLLYLNGQNPAWPLRILEAEYRQMLRNLERIRSGSYQHPWKSQTVTEQNPVFTNGLAQMTTGAPHVCFNGGLLMAAVRYFDPDRGEPGLPPDVAALVEGIFPGRVVLQLVNTSAFHSRTTIVQAGAYGEHEFTTPVRSRWLTVELPPATSIRLELGLRRFVHPPAYHALATTIGPALRAQP